MSHFLGKMLIISFYFPPYGKVGGRRWAKHCKYLKKEKVDFNVLCGAFFGKSAWDKDIMLFEKSIKRLKIVRKYYPFFMKKLPVGFFEKVYWKISYIIWQIRKKWLRGNYRDVSRGNENRFYKEAETLMSVENYKYVLISMGPFFYSNIIPKLKIKFPSTKFIIDYRDYWEDDFQGLTANQVKFEKQQQQRLLEIVDLILVPNQEMEEYYKSISNKRIFLLPHCFDEEDMELVTQPLLTQNNTVVLTYGGAFYHRIEESLELIKSLIDGLSKHKDLKCNFYVSLKGYEKQLNHPAIKRFGFIDSVDYFNEVRQSDYVILILAEDRVNAMSSKFFELVALRKPILYFGNAGAVSEFIEKENLGFHITSQNLKKNIITLIENLKSKNIPNKSYDISKHTFAYHTNQLITTLQELN